MRVRSRFSRWLKAAAVLAVAECAGVAVVQAQSSGDFFRFDSSHVRYDKYRKNLFDPLGWERQRRKGKTKAGSGGPSDLENACGDCEQDGRRYSVAAPAAAILAGASLLCRSGR